MHAKYRKLEQKCKTYISTGSINYEQFFGILMGYLLGYLDRNTAENNTVRVKGANCYAVRCKNFVAFPLLFVPILLLSFQVPLVFSKIKKTAVQNITL